MLGRHTRNARRTFASTTLPATTPQSTVKAHNRAGYNNHHGPRPGPNGARATATSAAIPAPNNSCSASNVALNSNQTAKAQLHSPG
jgi:hypothetical protein